MNNEKNMKSIVRAVWVLVIFIILISIASFVREGNKDFQDDWDKNPENIVNINKQNDLNNALTKCVDRARNILINAEWNYCKNSGYTDEVCGNNLPDLSIGKYGDIARSEEHACYDQYPGGIYK